MVSCRGTQPPSFGAVRAVAVEIPKSDPHVASLLAACFLLATSLLRPQKVWIWSVFMKSEQVAPNAFLGCWNQWGSGGKGGPTTFPIMPRKACDAFLDSGGVSVISVTPTSVFCLCSSYPVWFKVLDLDWNRTIGSCFSKFVLQVVCV